MVVTKAPTTFDAMAVPLRTCEFLLQGINAQHQEFTTSAGASRIGAGYSFDGVSYANCNGHGTHISGTAAGLSFGLGKDVTIHTGMVRLCTTKLSRPYIASSCSPIAECNWLWHSHLRHSSRAQLSSEITPSTHIHEAGC